MSRAAISGARSSRTILPGKRSASHCGAFSLCALAGPSRTARGGSRAAALARQQRGPHRIGVVQSHPRDLHEWHGQSVAKVTCGPFASYPVGAQHTRDIGQSHAAGEQRLGWGVGFNLGHWGRLRVRILRALSNAPPPAPISTKRTRIRGSIQVRRQFLRYPSK